MRILTGILKVYVLFSCSLIFLSLSGLPPLASLAIRTFSGPAILLVFITRWMRRGKNCPQFIFPWFSGLLIWLLIQQAGIQFSLPFFDIPASWASWLDVYGLLVSGCALYLAVEESFNTRKSFTGFIYFLAGISALSAVYYIYLFYSAGGIAEAIKPPFPFLELFGGWGPVSFQPNNLVDMFFPGFFLSLSMILYGQRRKLRRSSQVDGISEILLFLLFLSVLLAGIFFTNSRAGILVFIIGIVIYLIFLVFFSGRRRRGIKFALWILGGAAIFLLTLGVQKIMGELGTVSATVADELANKGTRSMTISATWQLVCAKGFWGVGLGNFFMGWLLTHQAPNFSLPLRSYNDFLWFWAEGGLPGVVLLLSLFGAFIALSLRTVKKTESFMVSYFLNASCTVLMIYSLHAMVDPTFYVASLFWLLCVTLGIGGACVQMETMELQTGYVKTLEPRKNPVVIPGIVILSALAVSFFSFQSWRAVELTKAATTLASLQKAYALDKTNPFYGRALAILIFEQYKKDQKPELLRQAVDYLDESLDQDPFAIIFYRKKAAMYKEAGDWESVYKTFRDMHERLPAFYLAYMSEAGFFMENALSGALAENEKEKLRSMALRSYQKAVELNPDWGTTPERFLSMTPEVIAAFQTVFPEKKTATA